MGSVKMWVLRLCTVTQPTAPRKTQRYAVWDAEKKNIADKLSIVYLMDFEHEKIVPYFLRIPLDKNSVTQEQNLDNYVGSLNAEGEENIDRWGADRSNLVPACHSSILFLAQDTRPKSCPINRGFAEDELSELLGLLRQSENINTKNLFFANNCPLQASDKTIARLTTELNRTLNVYEISSIYQRIHFLCQIYWEGDRFKTTLEYGNGNNYELGQHTDANAYGNTVAGDGNRYMGRGFMQLTWRKGYEAYFKHIAQNFYRYKEVCIFEGRTLEEEILHLYQQNNPTATMENLDETVVYEILEDRENGFHRLVSDYLFFACDSAGWYFSVFKKVPKYNPKGVPAQIKYNYFKEAEFLTLNAIAKFQDKAIVPISWLVNGGGNGLSERQMFYRLFKQILQQEYLCEI